MGTWPGHADPGPRAARLPTTSHLRRWSPLFVALALPLAAYFETGEPFWFVARVAYAFARAANLATYLISTRFSRDGAERANPPSGSVGHLRSLLIWTSQWFLLASKTIGAISLLVVVRVVSGWQGVHLPTLAGHEMSVLGLCAALGAAVILVSTFLTAFHGTRGRFIRG